MSAQSSSYNHSTQHQDMLIEDLLYGESSDLRDQARSQLIQQATAQQLRYVVNALKSQKRITRRRATRFLSDMPSHRVIPLLLPFIESCLQQKDWEAKVRREAIEYALRILTTLSKGTQDILHQVIKDDDLKVRIACITPIADHDVLMLALQDKELKIAEKSAEYCIKKQVKIPEDLLDQLIEKWPTSLVFLRLHGKQYPQSIWLRKAVQDQTELALHYIQHIDTLSELLQHDESRVAGIWGLQRTYQSALLNQHQLKSTHIESLVLPYQNDANPLVRMAIARILPAEHPVLSALIQDEDPAVVWIAQQAQQGVFQATHLSARLGAHDRLNLPSATPPYGLHIHDQLHTVPRVKAALALCHTRFDVNVGVAMRSAEAAGLEALYVMEASSFSKRSTRGAELAIPLYQVHDAHHLIYQARSRGYQIVAVQQTPDSKPYHQVDYPPHPLFVLGSEDSGLPDELRIAADLVVEIPLHGLIDSLNVASAATCVIMHWRNHFT